MRGISDIFFRIVSIFAHPILLPTYFALTLDDIFGVSVLGIFMLTFAIPVTALALIYVISRYKRVSAAKIESEDRAELLNSVDSQLSSGSAWYNRIEDYYGTTRIRTLALGMLAALAVGGYFMVRVPMWSLIMLLIAIAAMVCLLINNFWHISIHSYGWGFALYTLVFKYSSLFQHKVLAACIVIFICGLVMSSRLYLGRHSKLQVYLGFLIGFLIPALLYFALSY